MHTHTNKEREREKHITQHTSKHDTTHSVLTNLLPSFPKRPGESTIPTILLIFFACSERYQPIDHNHNVEGKRRKKRRRRGGKTRVIVQQRTRKKREKRRETERRRGREGGWEEGVCTSWSASFFFSWACVTATSNDSIFSFAAVSWRCVSRNRCVWGGKRERMRERVRVREGE